MKVSKKLMPQEFINAIPVMKKIQTAGFEAFFVGGSVRDLLLEKPSHDIDIATSAFPEEIKTIFPHTIDVGIEHGTVLVLYEGADYEITTFRTESEYQDYRRPDEVFFVRNLSEDLKRRDFTINALAMDTEGNIVDLFGGRIDLEQQLIKAVGAAHERFNEDALRMMRAVRFASQLDFEIEEQTLTAIGELSPLLRHISIERTHIEFIKMMQGINRNRGFAYFLSSDLYKYCPGFENKKNSLATLLSLKHTKVLTEVEIWTLICYVLKIKEEKINAFLKKWKLPNKVIQSVKQVLPALYKRMKADWSKIDLYHMSEETVAMTEDILEMLDFPSNKTKYVKAYQALPIHSLKELAVTGSDILQLQQRNSGPWLGKLLQTLELKVLTGELSNSKDVLENFVKELDN